MPETPVPVSVVICTLNEQANIARCLSSVQWAGERLVVDAGSTDQTSDIAASLHATVVTHEWKGYSDQKNWALDNLAFAHDWVLFLDADERVTDELAREIASAITESRSKYLGYYVARRLIFMGRRLRHAWWYPDYNLRLFVRQHGRFENRLVHETVILQGLVGRLRNDLIHDDQRDIATYISRLNRYSTLESTEIFHLTSNRLASPHRLRGALGGTWVQRRRFMKEQVWYRLPMRPVIRFIWTMGFRLGFLDGREGLIFTLLQCVSEWHTNAKLYELRIGERRKRSTPAPMPDLPGP